MPILRAIFVVLFVSPAFAGQTERCGDALGEAIKVPMSRLKREAAFAPYAEFLPDFQPWIPRDREIVGRSRSGIGTWRIDFVARRMVYEQENTRGGVGLVNLARNAARAALAAHAAGVDLDQIALSFSPGGTLVAELPLDRAGTEFVIALENRTNHRRDFAPIDLMRWPSQVDRLPRSAAELADDGPTATERSGWDRVKTLARGWSLRLAGWWSSLASRRLPTEPAEVVAEELHYPPLPEKIRAFDDEQVAFVARWLDRQFPGLHVNALDRTMRWDVPAPLGMSDVVAHARRVAELLIRFERPGLDLATLAVSVSPDARLFRIEGIPWNSTGAFFLEQFGRALASEDYARPVVVPGLEERESERVRGVLGGLAPYVNYVRGETAYFVRPPDPVPPTPGELERIHQAKGAALPLALRRSFTTLARNEAAFSSLGVWAHETRANQDDDDRWTASNFGVEAVVNVSSGRISFAFADPPGEARARVERVLASLFSTRDRFDFSSLALELGHGPFSGKLILSCSIDRLATRVLTEIRVPAEIDHREFTGETRRRATAWFQERFDDARAARGGATPVRTAAE